MRPLRLALSDRIALNILQDRPEIAVPDTGQGVNPGIDKGLTIISHPLNRQFFANQTTVRMQQQAAFLPLGRDAGNFFLNDFPDFGDGVAEIAFRVGAPIVAETDDEGAQIADAGRLAGLRYRELDGGKGMPASDKALYMATTSLWLTR